MADTIALTQLIRIYPNSTMRKFIDKNIKYRNDIWNRGLRQWNYDYRDCQRKLASITFKPIKKGKKVVGTKQIHNYGRKAPSGRVVRNELVKQKTKDDRLYPNTVLADTMTDLDQSYQAFFDKSRPMAKRPKTKKPDSGLIKGSYCDSEARTKGKYLLLTSSRSDPKHKYYSRIKMTECVKDDRDMVRRKVRLLKKDQRYYVAIPVKVPKLELMPTGQNDAVDVNVGHFNSAGVKLNILPKKLKLYYQKIKHYQRQLSKKRLVNGKQIQYSGKNYQKVRYKLRQYYRKATNLQHDIVQKYTHYLFTTRDRITIEDLDVKHLLMTHVASKGMHRAMFGYFRQICAYKSIKYGKELVIANRLFGSTQECPRCHYVKIGDEKIGLNGNKKHHTKHNEYICYNCGYVSNRDDSAYQSLSIYAGEESYQWYNEIKKQITDQENN